MSESAPRHLRLPEPATPGGPAYPCLAEWARSLRLRDEPELPLEIPRYWPMPRGSGAPDSRHA